jgi:hypothetical protein
LKKLDLGGNRVAEFPDVSGLRALEALWQGRCTSQIQFDP